MAGELVGAYFAVLLVLIAAAGLLALCSEDDKQRNGAYRVLRLLIMAGAAGGVLGMLGLLARLHELGLLK